MYTKQICILIGSIFLYACQNKPANHNPHFADSDEAEITTAVFDKSVYPDTSFRRRQLEEYDLSRVDYSNFSEEQIRETKKKYESLKNLLNTNATYVVIKDTLLYIDPGYLDRALTSVQTNHPDSSFYIISKWRDQIKMDSLSDETFDINKLAFHYDYLYILHSQQKTIAHPAFYVGLFSISRICFNKDKNKAFVCSQFKCGGLCGNKREFYFEKKKGRWSIALDRMIMIY